MSDREEHGPRYGNLMSYKFCTRPAAHSQYGYFAGVKTKHRKNIHGVLRLLAAHGACTTWDMAKINLRSVPRIRGKEREYRRLFVGRSDRGRHSQGILEMGLAVREKKMIGRKPSWKYRLSLHGVLYFLDALEPGRNDVDRMAAAYATSLPRVFGRWDRLKSVLGDEVYKIRVLSKALFLENAGTPDGKSPIGELMSYVHTKYQRHYDTISERDLAEQISYWFYTYMLYYGHSAKSSKRMLDARMLVRQEPELRGWYADFFRDARDHYRDRLRTMRSGAMP